MASAVRISLRDLADRFDALFHAWERGGRQLYLVGGCVRDVLMEVEEIGDIDLTTDARPEETTAMLEAAGFPVYPIGARFGTISSLVNGTAIEITTFRVEEHYEKGSRKPHVTFGSSLEHDLSRRDLSINAMAAGRGGALFDPFDGQSAIAQRILEVPKGGLENTIGILRDDPLRLLRIARFCARLGFTPTDDTTAAAQLTAKELELISHERWKMELDKTLVAPHVGPGLRWLNDVGAFGVLFPSFAERAGESEALIARLEAGAPDLMARWASIFLAAAWMRRAGRLPDLGLAPDARVAPAYCGRRAGIAARYFRFSNEERALVQRLCAETPDQAMLEGAWDRVARRRFLATWGADYGSALELAYAWSTVDAAAFAELRAAMDAAHATEDVEVRLPRGFGNAVLTELGVPRGPAVSRAIAQVRQAVIDGVVPNDADEARYLAFLRENPVGDGEE